MPAKELQRATREERWTEAELDELEQEHPEGLPLQRIVELFRERGDRLSEATFRKYVQLGLLPRSKRVSRQGRGSQGLYPATSIRQLAHIRRLMAQGFTMGEIQKEFLFVRGDIESLSRQLERVYLAIEAAAGERARQGEELAVQGALDGARELGAKLIARLETIERGLTMRARMARAAV
ncbi:MAG: MerR family transcriptional regulator [Planctomycetota bacterium]